MPKFILVAAARPNFMKIAPLMSAFRRRNAAEVLLIHTGQHYDRALSDDFFSELGIPAPDINLGVGSGSHAEQTGRVMMGFEPVCLEHRPECVVVVGDVNSTMACAITAKKLGICVAHVEAGLRSRDMSMPEEINRLCTDVISDLLFTTDELASENLRREGVAEHKIHFAGNTMIDTLLANLDRARAFPVPDGLSEQGYAVLTLHRPGNVDAPETLAPLIDALRDIGQRIPILFPVHPRTRGNLDRFGLTSRLAPNIQLIEPLGYLRFIGLVSRARMVLTDSGGIQEETTVMGVPCVTMRPNTERPITCTLGTNILAGTDPVRIREAALEVLAGRARDVQIPPLWDGRAGERIVETLIQSAGTAA
jgi:UDP-N-acetylglucosamine 2-epimerase (non-hydrolysing)